MWGLGRTTYVKWLQFNWCAYFQTNNYGHWKIYSAIEHISMEEPDKLGLVCGGNSMDLQRELEHVFSDYRTVKKYTNSWRQKGTLWGFRRSENIKHKWIR